MRKSAVATKMPGDFAAVFDQLKQLVRQKSAGTKLAVITDEPGNYCLTAGYSERFKKDLWFGGVRSGKRYVSLHLMPLYMNDKLRATLSPALLARMQGKSCFNFTKPLEPTMLREVGELIHRCIRGFSSFIAAPTSTKEKTKHEGTKPRSSSRKWKPAS